MNSPFDSDYSQAYDFLYHDKDYQQECRLIETIFQEHGEGKVRRILDLGCGTGNHAIRLAQLGYDVVGVDRSEPMLALARNKADRIPDKSRMEFRPGDIRTIELPGRFDAVLMMFAVLGYQLTNDDVQSTLSAARRHLEPGGLLIFDVWFGPAVLAQRPSERNKVVRTQEAEYYRSTTGKLDIPNRVCTVHYTLKKMKRDQLLSESKEVHRMRYFSREELEAFLKETGYEIIRIGAFPDFEREPNETTWNVLVAARAV